MGVLMRMRASYRREWSGVPRLFAPGASWSRFTCYVGLFLLAAGATMFSRHANPNSGAVLMSAIVFGAAAARQWKKLRRWHPTPPAVLRKPRGRGRYDDANRREESDDGR
jgi:hypothetical protein